MVLITGVPLRCPFSIIELLSLLHYSLLLFYPVRYSYTDRAVVLFCRINDSSSPKSVSLQAHTQVLPPFCKRTRFILKATGCLANMRRNIHMIARMKEGDHEERNNYIKELITFIDLHSSPLLNTTKVG